MSGASSSSLTVVAATASESSSSYSNRRKDSFRDCALVEIIHLHDCLRGALKALQQDVLMLSQTADTAPTASDTTTTSQANITNNNNDSILRVLERKVSGRFKVIWSVFQAHSKAEDEFIWPALQVKTGKYIGSPKYDPTDPSPTTAMNNDDSSTIEQEDYAEDHADEERMFKSVDSLLTQLRDQFVSSSATTSSSSSAQSSTTTTTIAATTDRISLQDTARAITDKTAHLMQHLLTHLEKEETECMPLVLKYLNEDEIKDLVGKIMGKRSSEMIASIMEMAIDNLEQEEREEMVKYMKQAMRGTFFEKWLAMSGWMNDDDNGMKEEAAKRKIDAEEESTNKKLKASDTALPAIVSSPTIQKITSRAELERLIRAIVLNPALTPIQKNTTIQGLRDSVWKCNMRHNAGCQIQLCGGVAGASVVVIPPTVATMPAAATLPTRQARDKPPTSYYKKTTAGNITLVSSSREEVPLFTASELAPTFHDGANGAVLGCPHYARACKLRHPKSGRLYTCRLCCEQERENPLKEQDSPLDRYDVTEVFCMKCNALQPAGDRCINPECQGSLFSRYYCKICNLYDDDPNKNVYHCPFCNVCKIGRGLGIDYRHCMRCNACVSLEEDSHQCIPQRLESSCPICRESMFESTEPLRGLECGHVLHLSCFVMYMRGGSYTCPLCKKSVENMQEYFSMLDAAVRMQPMPEAYASTVSNIYCQDCSKTGQVPYHFVGCKCLHCGSYNTRELGRVQNYSHSTTH